MLLAWLLATGAQWDLVQAFAWSQMLVTNSQTMSFSRAVEKTFSGEQCAICTTVEQGRRSSSASEAASLKAPAKIFLVQTPIQRVMADYRPAVLGLTCEPMTKMAMERRSPPVPPPRISV